MIVSASVRSDIPAFYGDWFMRRVEAGYALVRNPYNDEPFRVELRRHWIHGFIFWTKNLGPFLPRLRELAAKKYPFYVSYSITGYPTALEVSVVDAMRATRHMRAIAEEYGPRAAVWRYDPIVITSITGFDWHRENFARLADEMAGTTDEVCVSFAQIYAKTRRNLDAAVREHGFAWTDPEAAEKIAFIRELNAIAATRGIRLTLCAQREYLSDGVADACCVDPARMSDISGLPVAAKQPGHRGKLCGCYASRDVGAYDSCPHGCVYCYAVERHDLAKRRFRAHDPSSEFLIGDAADRA